MKPPPAGSRLRFVLTLFLSALFLIPSGSLFAQRRTSESEGLSVFVDAGMLIPSAKQANFYCGRPENPNTIERVLYSNSYGQQIWTSLRDQGLLQGVGSYSEIQLADYPDMYYKLAYQIGVGIRYGYAHGWGWLLRFDFSQLTAAGVFHLYNGPQAGILTNQDRYVTCGMFGSERRIYIDIALTKRFSLGKRFELEADLGYNLNNTKVMKHQMEIGGEYYSILDVWNGQNPYAGIGSYEYINQGGLGMGAFATLSLCYAIPGYGSLEFGYTCYHTQTVFTDYNKSDAFAFQHLIFVRANLNNFSFWND